MDPREAPTAQRPPSGPPNMMIGQTAYPTGMHNNVNASSMMSPNSVGGVHTASMMSASGLSGGRFPFNSVNQPPATKSLESLGSNPYDGSPLLRPCGSGGMSGFNMDSGSKKKRGRPRKYSPDGNIALGLTPTPISASTPVGHGDSSGTPSSEQNQSKKNRGRPPSSGKKQMDALGAGGVGFTPHVIMINANEDIASKLVSFSQEGPRTVMILSATGAVCNVTLRQQASGGTVYCEGRFEIISLTGSFFPAENNGYNRNRASSLCISLAGSDGRVLGGGIYGPLTAAMPVQVIVGSFIAEGKKSNANALKPGSSSQSPQMINFGTPVTAASPPSQGGSSDSSDEDGSSPLNRGPGIFNNSNQPIHNMQVYPSWAGQIQH